MQSLAVQSDQLIKTIEGFKASSTAPFVHGTDFAGYVYIDKNPKRLCVVFKNLAYKLFNPESIIDVNIVENNSTVSNTGNQIGRAIVGGVLLGGAGAVIGGLTAGNSIVDDLRVVVHLNDFDCHTIELNCLTTPNIKRNSPDYQKVINAANSWYGLFNVLMHSNDQNNNIHNVQN